jgi:hypothetical protein
LVEYKQLVESTFKKKNFKSKHNKPWLGSTSRPQTDLIYLWVMTGRTAAMVFELAMCFKSTFSFDLP